MSTTKVAIAAAVEQRERDLYLVMKHLLLEAGIESNQWSSTPVEVSIYSLAVDSLDLTPDCQHCDELRTVTGQPFKHNIHLALNETTGEVIGIVEPPFATTR
jgi:hypothetical protein